MLQVTLIKKDGTMETVHCESVVSGSYRTLLLYIGRELVDIINIYDYYKAQDNDPVMYRISYEV